MKISVLLFDHVLASATTGLVDCFRVANALARRPVIECNLVGLSAGEIRTSSGIAVPVKKASVRGLDWLVLPGLDHASVEDVALRVRRLRGIVDQVGAAAAHGASVATCCSSAFFLADAGLVAGRRATTSWWLAAELARRYPDGPALTAGAMTAYFDLALHLVELAGGTELKAQCARILLLDAGRQSQRTYASPAALAHRPFLIEQAHQWMSARLGTVELCLADLAAHCCVSPRTLLRRFRRALGMTPQEYLRQLRIEKAKALIETSIMAMDIVAMQCGYRDTNAFRAAFKVVTSVSPTAYRQRFGLARSVAAET
jgi:transcriptional regulator GlxA family with amidase domain